MGFSARSAGSREISPPMSATLPPAGSGMSSQPAPAGRAILVTYASRGGSTAGVAEAIGRTLAERGLEVDVRPMDAVHDLAPYRAVVAGSAVRRERWLPEALRFMQR